MISTLASLTHLQTLHLATAKIADVSALSMLTRLRFLELYENEIVDVRLLSGLTQLGQLTLHGNQIRDVSPLTTLIGLYSLTLALNPIRNTAPLLRLRSLKSLDILVAGAADAAWMPDAVLEGVVRHKLGIAIGDPLTQDAMERLDVLLANYYYEITDLRGLEHAPHLRILSLPGNAITDLRPLAGLTALEHLSLHENQITDLRPLATLTKLEGVLILRLREKQRQMRLPEVIVDIQLTEPPVELPADVNADGVVNIQDLVLVASHFGEIGGSVADVNGDDVVNIGDLVLVAGTLGK